MTLVLLVVTLAAISASLLDIPRYNPAYSKVIGEYDVSRLGTGFGNGEAYAIGANSQGMPIFKNPDQALRQALIDYQEGFQAIQAEYHLLPVSKYYWKKYKIYGWQLTTEDQDILKAGNRVSQFFDIYENSFG